MCCLDTLEQGPLKIPGEEEGAQGLKHSHTAYDQQRHASYLIY